MKISVNCPSYKRPVVETLKYLPFCKIWVDNKEAEEYKKANKGFEDNIISVPEGIQGNVSRIRNYILEEEFKRGIDVVCIIDDDMKGIYRFEKKKESNFGYEKHLVKADEFMDFLENYSILCEELGFKLWGINLNGDKLSYRHYAPFSFNSCILGPFSCHLRNNIRYDESLPLKEDYDISLQHLNKYRGILRINKYHYICKQSTNTGGCATYRNLDREIAQLKKFQKKWGCDIVKIDYSNKGKTKKQKRIDYNPIVKVPIKGI